MDLRIHDQLVKADMLQLISIHFGYFWPGMAQAEGEYIVKPLPIGTISADRGVHTTTQPDEQHMRMHTYR